MPSIGSLQGPTPAPSSRMEWRAASPLGPGHPPGPRPSFSSPRLRDGTETRPLSFLPAGRCQTSLSRFDSDKHSLLSNCPDLASRQSRCIAAPPASTPSDTQNPRPSTALDDHTIAVEDRPHISPSFPPVTDRHQTAAPSSVPTSNLACRRASSPNTRRRRTLTGRSDGTPAAPFPVRHAPLSWHHPQHCFCRPPSDDT